jgi:quercetin dioxygenase-like cupin family protein
MGENTSKYLTRIKDLPLVWLTEKSRSNMLMTDRVMISFIENPAGCVFPVHDHEAEQILIILEGSEDHICGDETFLMKEGDICIHPAGVPHGGETKTGFKGIDIFVPPRKEHVELLKKTLAGQGETKTGRY